MNDTSASPPPVAGNKAMLWTGRILSALVGLAMVASGVMKFNRSQQLVEGMSHLGWPDRLAPTLGVVELACAILYLIPQTSVLGAILLTGYLGGAIATHVRIGEPVYIHIALGVVIWLGLALRSPKLFPLIFWRR